MTSASPDTSAVAPSRAVILHGYRGTPDSHWFGWLASRLETDGVAVTVPVLPDPLAPDPGAWARAAGGAIGVPDERTVVVAHSLGGLTALRHLASLSGEWRLGALVLVAGFLEPLPGLPVLDAFISGECDVSGFSDRIERIVVIRSDDDPAVPGELTDRLAELLGAGVEVIEGGGHFLAAQGFDTLPEVYLAIGSHEARRR